MSAPRPYQVRVHGRGGQGVVTTAELLSVAAFHDGKWAQAIPSFGSERMGAPVTAFCRISRTAIRARDPVDEPDAVIVADASLLHHVDVFAGLTEDGIVLLNSERTPAELGLSPLADRMPGVQIRTVPATRIARETIGRPLPNAALVGALAAITGVISLASVDRALRGRFAGNVAGANIAAARHAADFVQPEVSHA